MKKISQVEARRLRKRVQELAQTICDHRRSFGRTYPGSVHLGNLTLDADWFRGRLEASQMLRHAIVVAVEGTQAKFYAVPLAPLP